MSIKTFIIINKIYLYVTPAVQEIHSNRSNPPNLIQNVPFCTKTLNLLFLEKHKYRFAPLILSFPPGGEMLSSPMPGLGLLLFKNLKRINSNYYH